MENYDLSTISRDQLYRFLSSAKNEMGNYTRCHERIEKLHADIEKEKKEEKNYKGGATGGVLVGLLFFILMGIVLFFTSGFTGEGARLMLGFWGMGIMPLLIYLLLRFRRKKCRLNLKNYEAQLPDLQRNEEEAFNKFFSVIEPYKFPRKYWYEYALIKMHEYVEDREASNWERVTDLYKRHIHELTMQENTRKTFEEAIKQTEIAMQTRNAARWAAAGVWIN